MKFFTYSIAAVLALSTFAVAGGDIEPVEEIIVAPMPDESGFYIGGAYSYIHGEMDAYGASGYGEREPSEWWRETAESDTSGFMLQLGYQFNKYIAVEGRYWNGGTEMDGTYTDDSMEGESDTWERKCADINAWGIYLKPMYPVTDAMSIYGLLGYGNTNVEDEWYGFDMKLLDENGFQWGVGASYAYDEHISFFIDYVQLANDAEESFDWIANGYSTNYDYMYSEWDISVYTINFGVSYKF